MLETPAISLPRLFTEPGLISLNATGCSHHCHTVGGQFIVLDGQRDLIGEHFALELADGRHWDFFCAKGDPVSRAYGSVNTDGEGLLPLMMGN